MSKSKKPAVVRKRAHRFVVGYPEDGQCVYGPNGNKACIGHLIMLYTERGAVRRIKHMPLSGAVPFELVPRPDLGVSKGLAK